MPLRQGEYSGDDGGGFRWRVRIAAPLAHQQLSADAAGKDPVLYPVEVGVSWQSGFSRREVQLRSERIGAK